MEDIYLDLPFIRNKKAKKATFDGVEECLLTGKGGLEAIASNEPPGVADPSHPTYKEIRALRLYFNYEDMFDRSPEYFGKYYGPPADRLIGGEEYICLTNDGPATLMLQIPDNFNPAQPILFASASSGSRGIYGAVPICGEYALKNGFAACYTDKGAGVGLHNLSEGTVSLAWGERGRLDELTDEEKSWVNFEVDVSDDFVKAHPNRFAVKHAHAQKNQQKNWGRDILYSIKMSKHVLRKKFGDSFDEKKLLVIALGVSNGGNAVLKAAEEDVDDIIDAVIASEPSICPNMSGVEFNKEAKIIQGDIGISLEKCGRNLFELHAYLNVLQPSANLNDSVDKIELAHDALAPIYAGRTMELKQLGILEGNTLEELAKDAQRRINEIGIQKEQNGIQSLNVEMDTSHLISYVYGSSYAKLSAEDMFCGYSLAYADATTSMPVRCPRDALAFALYAGIGSTKQFDVRVICERSADGPVHFVKSKNEDGRYLMSLDGQLAMLRCISGKDGSQKEASEQEAAMHNRIRESIREIEHTGNLRGKPTVVVQGRMDSVVFPNHCVRPYLLLSNRIEGKNSHLKYYELERGQHYDVMNSLLPLYKPNWEPLMNVQLYFLRTVELLLAELVSKKDKNAVIDALPPSQVIRYTKPEEIGDDLIPAKPEEGNRILLKDEDVLYVPE